AARPPPDGAPDPSRRSPPDNAEARRVHKPNSTVRNRHAFEGIFGKQCSAVEIGSVEQRRDLSYGRYPERRFDHASGHHAEVVRARDVNEPDRFAKTAALCELDVDRVTRSGQTWYVGGDEAGFVGDHGEPAALAYEAHALDICGSDGLFE